MRPGMLDPHFVRNHPEIVRATLKQKRIDVDLDALLVLDRMRREQCTRVDGQRARKNELAATIPKAPPSTREVLVREAKELRTALEESEKELADLEARCTQQFLRLPSIPRAEVPVGQGEEDNIEVRRVGTPRIFPFPIKDHVELAQSLGLVDWDGPRRFAGGRSYALVGAGALLELAVTRLALDLLVARGFTPVLPPVLVRERAMIGTGYFPFGQDEAYAISDDALFLAGTSEVPLVSMHADRVFTPEELPVRCAGLSPCFRREAGAHGKDTRGLYRVHQFTKVEQVVFCLPEEALAEALHYELLANAEALVSALEIPYRIALACTGEMGVGQTRKHELESWMPGRNAFAETHSCSTLGDFQARRLNIRVRQPDGSLQFVYTLNNTTVASPRILIPLLENHQNEDGSVTLPKALLPYMNGVETLTPRRT